MKNHWTWERYVHEGLTEERRRHLIDQVYDGLDLPFDILYHLMEYDTDENDEDQPQV